MEASPGSNWTPNHRDSRSSSSSLPVVSHFGKTVALQDWWLIRADEDFEGKRLAVAGFTSRTQEAFRVFRSAAIIKRYDIFSVETADGITVFLHGFINKTRTSENGFPSQVFTHFLCGFPSYWKECAEDFLAQALNVANDSQDTYNVNKPTSSTAVTGTRDSCPVSPKSHPSLSGCQVTAVRSAADDAEGEAELSSIPSRKIVLALTCTRDSHPVSSTSHPSLSGCQVKAVRSAADDAELDAEPLGSCGVQSSGKIDDLESGRKKMKNSIGKSKAKTSANADGKTTKNVGLEECSKDSCMDDPKASNFDHSVPFEASSFVLGRTHDKPGSSDPFGTPLMVVEGTTNKSPSDPGGIKCIHLRRNLKYNLQEASMSTCSMKRKGKEPRLESVKHQDGRKLKSSSTKTSVASENVDIQGAILRAAKKLVDSSEKSKEKEKNEEIGVSGETSSRKKARKKIVFEFDALENTSTPKTEEKTPLQKNREEKNCILSPESLSLKRSRSGRLLMPALDFWRNQIPVYDKDRNITGIQQEMYAGKPSTGNNPQPPKKHKRREEEFLNANDEMVLGHTIR